jgi:HEAT repeat protein
MSALARETGLTVRFTSDGGRERVDVEIFEVSLAEALERILAHRGHSRVGAQVWIGSPVSGFVEAGAPVVHAGHEAYVAGLGAQAISDESDRNRLAATAELVRERSEAAVAALRDVLGGDAGPQVRASALHGLERDREMSIESLVDLARDEDAGVLRRKAVRLLARYGADDPRAEAALGELAAVASDPLLRLTAETALREMGGRAA